MHKIISTVFLFSILTAFAQQTLTGSQSQNFIYNATYIEEVDLSNVQASDSDDRIEEITYMDGLRRAIQNIQLDVGGQSENLVTHYEYDAYGRKLKSYLPYAITGSSFSYRPNALSETESFYNTSEFENTTNPFYQYKYSNDPTQKMIESSAPGLSWNMSNGNTQKQEHQIDYVSDDVINFGINYPTNRITSPSLNYVSKTQNADAFYITRYKNENWNGTGDDNTTLLFYDDDENLVLKRSYNNDEAHDTYYVYDDFGNLTYVIPPKAADIILVQTGNPSPSPSTQNDYDWKDIILVDGDMADDNDRKYEDYEDKQTRDDDIASTFDGQGGFTLKVLDDGSYSVVFNISATTPFSLKVGIVGAFTPISKESIDVKLGEISGPGYSYAFAVQNNNLIVSGSGEITSLNQTFSSAVTNIQYEISEDVLNNLCYQYHYDSKNRIVERKIPGKDWEYIVYDKFSRPLLKQDGALRENDKWYFTKYDELSRVAYTGFATSYYSRASLQQFIDLNQDVHEEQTTSSITIDGTQLYYTNTIDLTEIATLSLLTINYYTEYIDTNGLSIPSAIYGVPLTNNKSLLKTVSKVKVLETNDWITSVIGYDHKLRPIYVASTNDYLETTDIYSMKLDFSGKVIETELKHQKGTNPEIRIRDYFTYDNFKRLLSHNQRIGTGALQLIRKSEYDKLGRIKSKEIGNTETNPLQKIDYTFNIRGWVKEINNVASLGNDLFAYKINYNDVDNISATPLFNGNISEVYWKSANDNKKRGYYYDYDALNRLENANYIGHQITLPDGDGTSTIYNENYSTKDITYDKNGNIQSLKRYGYGENQSDGSAFIDLVDFLSYTYETNTNKLIDVVDSSESLSGDIGAANNNNQKGLFSDRTSSAGDIFTYDVNGNMKTDDNKYITNIEYNHLNNPTEIEFTFPDNSVKRIEYIYTANGRKLEKKYYDPSLTKTKEYAGIFIYEDDNLRMFKNREGYVNKLPTGQYRYVFQHKDHLGNVRINFSDVDTNGSVNASEILEENNYYAFGGSHKGYNNVVVEQHEFKYNGIEKEEVFGLNLYEMDFRQYDAAIGRFTSIDPVTHFSISTYAGFDNNPIFWSDPSGANGEDYDQWDLEDYGSQEQDRTEPKPDRPGEHDLEYVDEDGDGIGWQWDESKGDWVKAYGQDPVVVTANRDDYFGERDDRLEYPLDLDRNKGIFIPSEITSNDNNKEKIIRKPYNPFRDVNERIRIKLELVKINRIKDKIDSTQERVSISNNYLKAIEGTEEIDKWFLTRDAGDIGVQAGNALMKSRFEGDSVNGMREIERLLEEVDSIRDIILEIHRDRLNRGN